MKIKTTNKNYIYKKANFPKKQEKKNSRHYYYKRMLRKM